MSATFSDLIQYFDLLARQHTDIGHSDLQKHFFRMELDEVLAGINRTDVAHPFLILEGYSYGFTDEKADNIIKNRSGAFMLLDNVPDPSDYNRVNEVWQHMEEIGDELLRRIRSDKYIVPVVRSFQLEEVKAELLALEITNLFGIRYTYSLSSPLPMDLNPLKWNIVTP